MKRREAILIGRNPGDFLFKDNSLYAFCYRFVSTRQSHLSMCGRYALGIVWVLFPEPFPLMLILL